LVFQNKINADSKPEAEIMSSQTLIPAERIERAILQIRGQKVMLDRELAAMYGVQTKILNKAVARNLGRFPPDFMFRLTKEERSSLRFQFGTLKRGQHSKYLPYAFTEQGVAMLSSVLRSPRAVQVNIAIMRAFVRLREMLLSNADLARKLAALEAKYDSQFKVVCEAIRQLMAPPETPGKPEIGFHVKEGSVRYRTRMPAKPKREHGPKAGFVCLVSHIWRISSSNCDVFSV
jgi:phage regulator Rha-like protein